jgi:S-adenosylmethionine:tRNA ribosyltransferase-isomerase
MDVRDFDFDLPSELIAQEPPPDRGAARLLFLDRDGGSLAHSHVSALPDFLRAGDLLVVNNTRVFPARLLGRRVPSGGAVECLLIRSLSGADRGSDPGLTPGELWEALVHPGQKLKPGAQLVFEGESRPRVRALDHGGHGGHGGGNLQDRPSMSSVSPVVKAHTLHGEVLERRFFGRRVVRLWTEDDTPVDAAVDAIGHVPLPPYIKRHDRVEDRDRYQTVFAQARGSIAAPTAGLHFTPSLMAALTERGVETTAITLHVGYGTFQPVRVDRVEDHRVESECYNISAEAAAALTRARGEHRRIIAVGTTTTRTLEAVALAHDGEIVAGHGATDLFIYPGFTFRVVDGLLTNFHLPRSSLLMLVSAFSGRDLVRTAYDAAIAERYRFYSYGDAMLVL